MASTTVSLIIRFLPAALAAGLGLAMAGCGHPPAETPPATPAATVSYPVQREITDFADFTARTAAVDSVELRARVSGYLDKVNFKEGALVKKGDLLFVIDPRPFQAIYDRSVGQVLLSESKLKLAKLEIDRGLKISKTPGAISQSDLDKLAADHSSAEAMLQTAKADADSAELNLKFTQVRAPVTGRISRFDVTVGNLVQAGDVTGGTLLTTIVSVDPMYAYFDVDEHTLLRVKELIRQGKAKTQDDPDIPLWLGLANETGHPHKGTVNFVDNQVNPRTGTLRVRGVFRNEDNFISPGMFGRIRVPIGEPHKALLITDRALDTDQGQKIVYVVDSDNKVTSRPVRLGALHDGLREITDGLTSGDRVIVNGLQQVRPGMTVEANLVEMPKKR